MHKVILATLAALADPAVLMPIVIVVIIVIMLLVRTYARGRYTKVWQHGRQWNVIGTFANSRDAAALLAQTHANMVNFMRVLSKKYHIDETDDLIAREGPAHTAVVEMPGDTHAMVAHLLDNYNPDEFYETDPRITDETSFTVGKGRAMHICLRDKRDPLKFVDMNTLIFTWLHEMAHIANYNGWGHDEHYWRVFKWLLHEAVAAGVYKYVNYASSPVTFCGLTIAYQPLDDASLGRIWVR